MLLHHAMHPRLPNHGNQVSNLQHPDKDPLINRVEAFSNGVFAIAITLLALGSQSRTSSARSGSTTTDV